MVFFIYYIFKSIIMNTNLRRSPRFINRTVTVPVASINININTIKTMCATLKQKLRDIEFSVCWNYKLKKTNSLFKLMLQKEYIDFIKSKSRLHTTFLNKATELRQWITYLNHNGSLENKVALIKTSKRLEKALL